MKTRIVVIALTLIVLFAFVASVAAQPGPPPLPSSFWGTVRINGQNVPVGTEISAWINGTRYAWMASFTYPGWGSVYALDVPGDQIGTPQIEGGKAGDMVRFKVGNYWADQTALWCSGTNTRLDLTASTLLRSKFFRILRP